MVPRYNRCDPLITKHLDKYMKRCFLIATLLVFIGCSKPGQGEGSWQPAPTDEKTGDVIAFWIHRGQTSQPVTVGLDYDYGMITIWTDRERMFYLYDNVDKKYWGTGDFDLFLHQLDRLPQEVTLHWMTKCQEGFAPAMPEKAKSQIQNVLSRGNRKTETPIIPCTCEGGVVQFPEIAPSAEGDG